METKTNQTLWLKLAGLCGLPAIAFNGGLFLSGSIGLLF
jgi:hypothetical protein